MEVAYTPPHTHTCTGTPSQPSRWDFYRRLRSLIGGWLGPNKPNKSNKVIDGHRAGPRLYIGFTADHVAQIQLLRRPGVRTYELAHVDTVHDICARRPLRVRAHSRARAVYCGHAFGHLATPTPSLMSTPCERPCPGPYTHPEARPTPTVIGDHSASNRRLLHGKRNCSTHL